MSGCSNFSTWSVISISSWKQEQRSKGQASIIFIILPVPQNHLENVIAPSLVPRGRYFMDYSIPSQFTRSKSLLEIQPLVISRILVCVFPVWFVTTF